MHNRLTNRQHRQLRHHHRCHALLRRNASSVARRVAGLATRRAAASTTFTVSVLGTVPDPVWDRVAPYYTIRRRRTHNTDICRIRVRRPRRTWIISLHMHLITTTTTNNNINATIMNPPSAAIISIDRSVTGSSTVDRISILPWRVGHDLQSASIML
jgi:hypothetical protein